MAPKTILLLISDPLLLTVACEILETEGYFVLSANGIGPAVDRLKECKADLLITRSSISSMTGHEAAKYLRTKCPGMRVLIAGGLFEDDRLRSRMLVEGVEVFPKPYSATEFLGKVKEMLAPVHVAAAHRSERGLAAESGTRF